MSIIYLIQNSYKFNISEKPTSENSYFEMPPPDEIFVHKDIKVSKKPQTEISRIMEQQLGVRRNEGGKSERNRQLQVYLLSLFTAFGLGFISSEVSHNPQILQELNDSLNIKKPNLPNNK